MKKTDAKRIGRAGAGSPADRRDPNRRSLIAAARLRRKVHRVTDLLATRYGSPHHDNKDDPLDELIFIILSQMTTHWSFGRVYNRLKKAASSWRLLLSMPPHRVRTLIADAGLSRQKTRQILAIVRRLDSDFGDVSLEALKSMRTFAAEAYLTSLPGVGVKTAKCVLMYSLGRPVLPVDTHVRRIATRVGLIGPRVPHSKVHGVLEAVVAPRDRYRFHVNAIVHGRNVCVAKVPRCAECVLAAICAYPHASTVPSDEAAHPPSILT